MTSQKRMLKAIRLLSKKVKRLDARQRDMKTRLGVVESRLYSLEHPEEKP